MVGGAGFGQPRSRVDVDGDQGARRTDAAPDCDDPADGVADDLLKNIEGAVLVYLSIPLLFLLVATGDTAVKARSG